MTSEEIIARQGEIEERKAQIDAEVENPEADLDALNQDREAGVRSRGGQGRRGGRDPAEDRRG